MIERVAAAAIFGEGRVRVISLSRLIKRDVLDDRTKPDGIPNDRFVFLTQVDGLRVAAAFDVKDRALRPAVLIAPN